MVDTAKLQPSPFQARKSMGDEELRSLTESIRASGVIQPILARRVGQRFEIIAGERRWRASQAAGLTQVPVLVRGVSDDDAAVFGIIENLQREDLNAIEKAQGLKHLLSRLGGTHESLGGRIGLDRSTVSNLLRLLDLSPQVQAHVSRGTLSMGHARALLAVANEDVQVKLADEAVRLGLSVRELERRLRPDTHPATSEAMPTAARTDKQTSRPVWVTELEETLMEALATKVSVQLGRKRSRITIECSNRDEFERLFQRLKNS
jgi:ParB family chromosome partitioning protein